MGWTIGVDEGVRRGGYPHENNVFPKIWKNTSQNSTYKYKWDLFIKVNLSEKTIDKCLEYDQF